MMISSSSSSFLLLFVMMATVACAWTPIVSSTRTHNNLLATSSNAFKLLRSKEPSSKLMFLQPISSSLKRNPFRQQKEAGEQPTVGGRQALKSSTLVDLHDAWTHPSILAEAPRSASIRYDPRRGERAVGGVRTAQTPLFFDLDDTPIHGVRSQQGLSRDHQS